MKKIFSLVSTILVVALFSCSRNTAPQGHYQSTTVVADGINNNEWQFPLRFTNNDYTLSYNITNDNRNIYIAIYSKDKEMQERILKAGISIFFDKKGETNTKVALNFPERNTASLYENKNETDTIQSVKKLFDNLDVYETIGFINTENGQHKVNDKRSKIKIGLKASVDSGLLYEAVIPIEEVLSNGLTGKNLRKNYSIGIDVHTVGGRLNDYNKRKNEQNNDGYRPQIRPSIGFGGGFGGMRGIGMGMGGGMRGGGGRNYNREDQKVPEEILWYQFKFSAQKS